jgi:putative transposase
MIKRQAFKYRLKTNASQEAILRRIAGCCRKVWNKVLAEQKARLEQGQFCERYNSFAKQLPLWKKTEALSWLKEAPASALQQKLKDLDRALQDAFDKKQPNKQFPKFKKRGCADSFRIPQDSQFKLEPKRVYLPKLGWLGFFSSRKIEGHPRQVTVSLEAGHWYLSIQTEMEIKEVSHSSKTAIGIDVGVSKLFALSNEEVIHPLASFKKHQRTLARLQRNLSRKTKFSNSWKKQKLKIQRLHTKIANSRKDYLHKSTTQISKNHAMIVLEDLQVSNLSKSAKGTKENPGRRIKAKSGLNKAILDQGWYEARRQLEYKQLWRGGLCVVVSPQYTSQTCSCCGHVDKQSRKTQSQFSCTACGFQMNADINAAKNILAAGHAVLAGGADGLLTAAMKPEPLVA